MRVYIDSSALVKRVSDEVHTDALTDALEKTLDEGGVVVTSGLTRVEVARALRLKLDVDEPRRIVVAATEVFDGISVAAIEGMVLDHARIIGPPLLRSLDAIHLATAVAIGADEVWTYDRRMAQVAEELGILSRSPV